MFVPLVHSESTLGPGDNSSFMYFAFVVSQTVPSPVINKQTLGFQKAFHSLVFMSNVTNE